MSENVDEVAEAHRAGIDMSYRAPDIPESMRHVLPTPILDAHEDWIDLYWRAWSIALDQVTEPVAESGLVPYCDAAFSYNIFQWDTCFMECFLRYAPKRFHSAGSLDNFYRKQHQDGFICREINSITGADFWERTHPSSINPPLFADAEWLLYQVTGDKDRLVDVLVPLCQYHSWLRDNRRTVDGIGYWTTALGSGMDNSPRAHDQGGDDVHEHYNYVWMCMTAQQALAARRISQIADAIGSADVAGDYRAESDELSRYVFSRFWNDSLNCYADIAPDGSVSSTMTPAMCWPLLLDGHPQTHASGVAAALSDPKLFWRSHAIPSLSADHDKYSASGHYWCGSVWPPMVYLAVRAMNQVGYRDLALSIAINHLDNLAAVYGETGTFWENYAPDRAQPGEISRPEFVGWTGCGPIAILIETILGFSVSAPDRMIEWNVSRQDRHGIRNLPMGQDHIDLLYEPDTHSVSVKSGEPFSLRICRDGQSEMLTGLVGTATRRLS